MVLGIAGACFFKKWLINNSITLKNLLLIMVSLAGLTISLWYLTGYFLYSDLGNYGATDFGYCSMNLNSLFNPIHGATILPGQPIYHELQFVGFNYMGLGMIVIMGLSFVLFISKPPSLKQIVSCSPIILISIGFTLLALSNNITFNDRLVFHYTPSETIAKLLNIFHAPGRFFWPVNYLIIFASFSFLQMIKKRYILVPLLLVCTCTQLYDLRWYIYTLQHHLNRQYSTVALHDP